MHVRECSGHLAGAEIRGERHVAADRRAVGVQHEHRTRDAVLSAVGCGSRRGYRRDRRLIAEDESTRVVGRALGRIVLPETKRHMAQAEYRNVDTMAQCRVPTAGAVGEIVRYAYGNMR